MNERSSKNAVICPEDVRSAAASIRGLVRRTSCQKSFTLSAILGAEIYIKFESEQFTAAFKERGALNKLLSLNDDERRRGVIAMSAGNHAKAVAWHAYKLGIPATIVMPKNTPNVKVEDTRRFGANVVLEGTEFDDSARHARNLAKELDLIMVHPYDDPIVMAGQGTVALEMLEQVPNIDVLVVPVGGGGLISGMACIAKSIKPEIKVVGVQCAKYPAVKNAFDNVANGNSYNGITIAEGIAVKTPGKFTLDCIERWVDDVITVSEEEIDEAIYAYLNIEKTVAEGAGAVSLAAVMANRQYFAGRCVGLVLSGANIDARILSTILMRNLARSGLIVQLQIASNDTPGSLAEIAGYLGRYGANILEVSHQRTFTRVCIRETLLNLMIEVKDKNDTDKLIDVLRKANFSVERLG